MCIGNIRKIIKFSAVDGLGNRTVVFLQGCNFDCLYCHNPETISMDTDEARQMTPQQVIEEMGTAIKYIRGITISGGECTIQRNFVLELAKQVKKENLSVLLDSNGFYDFSKDSELLRIVDGVMLDIKTIDSEEHKKICKAPNDIVLKNLNFLGSMKKLYEVRTVIVPELFDCEKTVSEVSKTIAPWENVRYKLIKYRPNGVRSEYIKGLKSPCESYMGKMAQIAKENGVSDIVII